MRLSLTSTGGKVLASTVVLGAAATIAGLGTFGSFTSTTSANQAVASGTVAIALGSAGTSGNRLSVAASGLVPGDTVQRTITLSNASGNQDLAGVTLTTTATPSSLLDTDATNGLQMVIDKCSQAWSETGTSPAYVYTCGGTTTSVLASTAVVGSNRTLSNLASLTNGSSDNLRVTLTLPSTADNTFQGKSSTLSFSFTGTQRNAAAH
ncbi:TasA family protein [Oryzihumus leptocrescens]|uniref:Camelysin-like metallo-endopeptidase n=1 Tax=Oryzihumus leptocrescens TaxID=297536 RepID=A0A542Z7K7_9MICO|nr:TasA family protein [Oryzihumus leptocrescens]TQL56325.1 camelysin-like metallo-endopeptidase [Oryzihumus leptocrescens]